MHRRLYHHLQLHLRCHRRRRDAWYIDYVPERRGAEERGAVAWRGDSTLYVAIVAAVAVRGYCGCTYVASRDHVNVLSRSDSIRFRTIG